jgi:hypothetical protein
MNLMMDMSIIAVFTMAFLAGVHTTAPIKN